jgi:hypothetical protein
MKKEEKRITALDMIVMQDDHIEDGRIDLTPGYLTVRETIATHYHDWLLGGDTYNWSIEKDMETGDIVLNRW